MVWSCLQIVLRFFSYYEEFSRICCLFFSYIHFPANPIVTQKRHFQQTSNKGHFCTIAPYTVVGGILVGWGQFIHPTSCNPKPRPNTPHNSGVMIKLLSKKIKLDQNHFVILSKKWKYFKHLKSMFQGFFQMFPKKIATWFSESERGVQGRLELFRRFIRIGSVISQVGWNSSSESGPNHCLKLFHQCPTRSHSTKMPKGQTLELNQTNFIHCSKFLSKEKIMLHF